MQIGVCGGFDRLGPAKEMGFDYAELAASAVGAMTEAEFEEKLQLVKCTGLPVPAFNVLFPGTITLMGATPDEEIQAYLEMVMSRMERMGGRVIVFGSGRSRNRPDGMSYEDAFRRLTEVTRMIGDAAGRHHLTVVIEPLNRTESNMINSVAEGACLCAAANHPAVKVLADYYHVTRDGEPFEDVLRVGGVKHVHIAAAISRKYPLCCEEGFTAFFDVLKKSGYDGMVSIEGSTDDFEHEAPIALRLLRGLAEG